MLVSKKKKFCLYIFYSSNYFLKKKRNFFYNTQILRKKRKFNYKNLHKPSRFFFSLKLNPKKLQKQQIPFVNHNHPDLVSPRVKTLFSTRCQNKQFLSRFVKSSQQSKDSFSNQKNLFFYFANHKQIFDLQNSNTTNLGTFFFKSIVFFKFKIFQKNRTHNFQQFEKKLWWWFFLKQKKNSTFQHQYWKNSLFNLYLDNKIFFLYKNIFFYKENMFLKLSKKFSAHLGETSEQVNFHWIKNHSKKRSEKKQIPLKNSAQPEFLKKKYELSKKQNSKFIIKKKRKLRMKN